MDKTTNKTDYADDLWDISDIPKGTRLRDWFDEGVWVMIVRSNFSMNVYMGVPLHHPLAGFNYDDLTVECHGGLTYAAKGDGDYLPEGYYWYGYDYSHAGDACFYRDGLDAFTGDKKWALREIQDDAWNAVYDFKKQMRFAEKILRKAK